MTQTVTINSPMLALYSSLYEKHSETLTCPCTNISIAQKEFISLMPTFHPICTSHFIDVRWPLGIADAGSGGYIYNRDFRFRGPTMFTALAALCALSNASISSALVSFKSTTLITSDVLPERVFTSQVNASIDLFIASEASSFTRSFRIIRDTTQGNGLVSSTLSSLSLRLVVQISASNNSSSQSITLRFKKYKNQTCSCHDTATCKEQSYVYAFESDSDVIFLVPGFVTGCYVFEGLMQSNLICLFNQSCIDQLRQAVDFSNNFTTLALDLSKLTRHQSNTTVENIMRDIMVEEWTRNISYANYFTQCRPVYCRYTYTKKYDVLFVITSIIAVIGGLTTILQIIVPRFVKLVRWLIKKQGQRRIQVNTIS